MLAIALQDRHISTVHGAAEGYYNYHLRQVLSEDEATEWANATKHAPHKVWVAQFSDGKIAPPGHDDNKNYFSSVDAAMPAITKLVTQGAQPVHCLAVVCNLMHDYRLLLPRSYL